MAQARHHLVAFVAAFLPVAAGAATLGGVALDLNGRPVVGAMVTVATGLPGPTAQTVYTDAAGHFEFPERDSFGSGDNLLVSLRALDHELLDHKVRRAGSDRLELTLLARPTTNQANAVPASAWLRGAGNHETNSTFVLDCIGCHQVPAVQFRNYAGAMADIPGPDRTDIAHRGWTAMIQYMNYISAEEFGRGPDVAPPDAVNVYSVGDGDRVIDFLTGHFHGRMNEISGYSWGAPLAVTPRTVIAEYEVPKPNAVREALLLGSTPQLYVADVASNLIYKVDPASNRQTPLTIPGADPIGPHSLHRGADGSLWVAPFVSSVIARLDVDSGRWQTWPMKTSEGKATGAHDLSLGADHVVLADHEGRIWFSDILNDSIGYFDPATGRTEIYRAPPLPPDRPRNGSLYGLVMSADRRTLWYSELNGGRIGSFNIETRRFETSVLLPANSGPRRLAIDDRGVLYVALYGRGQLLEYDTNARRIIDTLDLPDLASAPYAVTWDPVRHVVWIPTSNADAIYRFDPADKSFAVLPMPRSGALMRMVDVDPATGHLITSYANIVEQVHGPRMALIIDPGDDAYRNHRPAALQPVPANIARVPPTPAATPPVPQPRARDGASLVQAMHCYSCHTLKNPLLGPPYQTIALRYGANREQMTDILAHKIVLGGGGNWGLVPMVPNEQVSDEDAHIIARWILQQAP
jgi:cytochrome c